MVRRQKINRLVAVAVDRRWMYRFKFPIAAEERLRGRVMSIKHNLYEHKLYRNEISGGPGSAQALCIETTNVADETVEMWMSIDGDGPSLLLSPASCIELAHDLLARAALLADSTRGAEEVTS